MRTKLEGIKSGKAAQTELQVTELGTTRTNQEIPGEKVLRDFSNLLTEKQIHNLNRSNPIRASVPSAATGAMQSTKWILPWQGKNFMPKSSAALTRGETPGTSGEDDFYELFLAALEI